MRACLNEDELLSIAEGRLADGRDIDEHLFGCDACSALVAQLARERLARQVLTESPGPQLAAAARQEARPVPGRLAEEAHQSMLIIDDAQEMHDLVDTRLKTEGIRILHALDAEAGIALAREQHPDLLLLDLDLPGRGGLDICRELKADLDLATIPVIIITGTMDVATKVSALDAGAIDYVTKPFDAVELRARVRAALRTKRYQDLLATRAQIDGLTGLWNRAYFDARLDEDIAEARRTGQPLGLLMIDIDRFKVLNERYGHPFGDTVLRLVGSTISATLRASDVACRYGGEEFGVILRDTDAEAARRVGEQIRQAITALPFGPADRRVHVTVSIGSCGTDLVGGQPAVDTLLAAADRGLNFAKRAGRDCVCCGSRKPTEQLLSALIAELPPRPPGRQLLGAGGRLGCYEIMEPLGGGATGVVYRAFDDRLQREVAIKVIDGSALRRAGGWRRFEREARVLAALDHPGIVRIFDLGTAEWGDPYLVLELLEGHTLRTRLLGTGSLPLPEALRLTLELIDALAAAHAKGIVHRDLKPENLFLTASGRLKVLDFGLAKRVLGDATSGTAAGMVVGTAGYLAPEQAFGRPVDERSDIFAVGAILYELIAGRPAFPGESTMEKLEAVTAGDPPPITPPALDAVLRRCLAKDPAARFRCARDLEAALRALQA